MIKVMYASGTDGREKVITAYTLSTRGFKNGEFGLFSDTSVMIFIGVLSNIISITTTDEKEYKISRADDAWDDDLGF